MINRRLSSPLLVLICSTLLATILSAQLYGLPAFSIGANDDSKVVEKGTVDSSESCRIARPYAGLELKSGSKTLLQAVNIPPRADDRPQSTAVFSAIPTVHFWTGEDGVPNLDYRDPRKFDVTVNSKAPFNIYGGAVNSGNFRGFRLVGWGPIAVVNYGFWLGDSLQPQFWTSERVQMNRDDALSAAGESTISSIDLSGSGIFWGPEAGIEVGPRARAARQVTLEPLKKRSYLKGPVRIESDYIRFDGPVSRIGTDVTLIARRIVINGVELPAGEWREALNKMARGATDAKR